MNIQGNTLRALKVRGPQVTWDGRNDQGAIVESGVYIVRLEGKKELKPFKFIWNN